MRSAYEAASEGLPERRWKKETCNSNKLVVQIRCRQSVCTEPGMLRFLLGTASSWVDILHQVVKVVRNKVLIVARRTKEKSSCSKRRLGAASLLATSTNLFQALVKVS